MSRGKHQRHQQGVNSEHAIAWRTWPQPWQRTRAGGVIGTGLPPPAANRMNLFLHAAQGDIENIVSPGISEMAHKNI